MDQELYTQIGQQFTEQHGTTSGQMFGKPCLKIENKAFAAFFKGDMVFKLGRNAIGGLETQYPNAVLWDPSGKGRPMKDWFQVPVEYSAEWGDLARQALAFVQEGLAG